MDKPDIDALVAGVVRGDRRALARSITLVESTRADHRAQAGQVLEDLMPHTGRSIRVGISGTPGVGKSTFIESFGNFVIDRGHKVAVLAVDPSSTRSGGSILGDKTRMELLARRPEAFIRPSPSGGTLGGVARRTREAVLVCEAAGFDVVLVETVGVGQSETTVAQMTDLFALLIAPAGGDELQGIKRGIVEIADILVVNKADGELAAIAARTAADYAGALRLLRPKTGHWQVPVLTCSALTGAGIDSVWAHIERFRETATASGALAAQRAEQAREWMWAGAMEGLADELRRHEHVRANLPRLERAVRAGELPPTLAAQQLLALFLRETRRG
ncbi:MAG: methylmalonyl Co-A mutase-associated GTPase MeaB [Gammaproteobacteria bacterium]|nr:methylmalonyl Co-A mutase-associated GTPase MeaB [Gammaproteobacteria bacterium]